MELHHVPNTNFSNESAPSAETGSVSRRASALASQERLAWFIFSLFFNLLMMLLLLRMFSPVFDGTDDLTIVQFVNGSCGSYDPHMVYPNYLLGLALTALYRSFPMVPWYSWLQFLAICASFTAITYVLCCRIRKCGGFALALLVQSFAAYECYVVLQYTKTAGLLAAAGMLLFWNALWGTEDENADREEDDPAPGKILWTELLWGTALAVLSVLLRYAQFFACAALTAGIPLLMLLDAGKKSSAAPGRLRVFLRVSIGGLLLCALCAGLVVYDRGIYERDPVWKNFMEYNNTRSELMDYGLPDYEEHEALYTRLGITPTAYKLFDYWNSGDTAVFSTEVMRELIKAREVKRPGLSTAREFLEIVPAGFMKNRIVRCFAVILLLWIFFGRHDRRAVLALLAQALLFGVLYYYLFLKGRYLITRVDVGLWMSTLAVLLWTWKDEHRQIGASAIRAALILGVMALCAYRQVPGWEGRLRSHSEEDRIERAEFRKKMEEISGDTEHLYVSKLGVLSAAYCCGPFEPMPVGMLSNVVFLGGWKVESAPYNAILQKYGFSDNPYEAISGNSPDSFRVRLLDEHTDTTLTYLHEYYNPDAQIVAAGKWNGKAVWQVITGAEDKSPDSHTQEQDNHDEP